jgi:hypothetical protein
MGVVTLRSLKVPEMEVKIADKMKNDQFPYDETTQVNHKTNQQQNILRNN